MMKNIAILASGSGTNAENIIRYFADIKEGRTARVALVVTDNPGAGVIERAARLEVPLNVVPRADFRSGGARAIEVLAAHHTDYIVLAGFLSLVPPAVIDAWRGRIINIHPALLPEYGGRGMYGDNVHKAVIAAGERRSGITIHHVDEVYDSGSTIAQYSVVVTPDDTPESLAARIHELEYEYFPKVIEREIAKL